VTRDAKELKALTARVGALLDDAAGWPDSKAREQARELVRALLTIYVSALGTVLQAISRESPEVSQRLLDAFASDDLVASLLVLHDLHPHDPATRLAAGLSRVAAICGAPVELVSIQGSSASVSVGGPLPPWAPPSEVRRLIGDMIAALAPDITAVHVTGLPQADDHDFVQLGRRNPAAAAGASTVS
jgi:hypothetical protein